MILEMISMDSYEKIPGMIMKIQALKGGMSKAEQQVCDYIVAHPEEVIYLSVSELASASGVSDATVIRASLAAEKLMGARRIAICGLGNSSAIAADTQHKLMRLGLSASAYSDSHLQIIGASSMSKGDVLFTISHSGSSKDIVRVAEIAKENGAYVISLTSLGINPLSDIADLALYTASNETHYRAVALSSRIAQMAIVDAIYTFIALKKPDAVEGFYKLEKNLGDTKY